MGLFTIPTFRPCNLKARRLSAAAPTIPPALAFWVVLGAALGLSAVRPAAAQESFDPSWYDASATYVKIAVVEDGVYQVSGADLAAAGLSLPGINPTALQLFEEGTEIPIEFIGDDTSFDAADYFLFAGRRNTGEHEAWAYDGFATNQTGKYFSLYSDTTHYWLRYNGTNGLRYTEISPPPSGGPTRSTTRDERRIEDDLYYYPGQGSSAGNPIYTNAEGYYFNRIAHNTSQNRLVRSYSLDLRDRTSSATDTLYLSALVASETVSQHLVYLNVRLDVNGTPTMTAVDSVNWAGINVKTLFAAVPQDQLPAGSTINIEIVSSNEFGSGTPNNLLLDWLDASFVRTAQPVDGQFLLEGVDGGSSATYAVSNLSGPSRVLVPAAAEAFTISPATPTFAYQNGTAARPLFWVLDASAARSPADIALDTPSNLLSLDNSADYVIITAPALLASAQAMASYRQTEAGGSHQTLVVSINDVFDEFDYGRPTPLAVRRFVRHARNWAVPIEYLTLWGDALYAMRTRPIPTWEVLSFGHTVSDSWYAMQNDGPTDFAESIAIGRIPIRANDRGMTFVQKMQSYESQPLSTWQKRALFLVGGFTDSERIRLQQSSLQWSGRVAADPMGMDTLHYFKTSASVLDPTFQDSLQSALQKGASWEVYFGHSATQTWEIVTDPPAQYNNAERLPIVLSLGCFTGDFATGNGSATDILSFSEQLVVESLNGSIAHWGASSSGTIGASARISDEVHQTVFGDTVRVLGEALRLAKVAYDSLYSDPISVKHLLQYGLIGDPATHISLPSKPDFRVEASDIRVTPLAPVPADRELNVDVTLRNVGLTTQDSVQVELKHTLPNSTTATLLRTLPPFGSQSTEQFRIDIDDASVGLNRVRLAVDVDNRFTESNELNNSAEQPVTVFSSGLLVLSPIDYALLDTRNVKLRVTSSSADPNPPAAVFQIDPDPSFSSIDLVEQTVPISSLVAEWAPPGLTDGTWYWRVRVDRPEQENVWSSGAFTIDVPLGEQGWIQRGELLDADATSPTLLPHDEGWTLNNFDIPVSVASERGSGSELGQFTVGSDIYQRLGLGFGVLVLDGRNGSVRQSSSSPTYANDFVVPSVAYANLVSTLNVARDGDYVYVRTRHLGNKNGETVIPDSIKTLFAAIGSTEIQTLTYQDLWIFATRLGFPDETAEFTNAPTSGVNEIIRKFDPVFQYRDGSVLSPVIGPTAEWTSLNWDRTLPNQSSEVTLEVVSASADSVLLSDLETGPVDLSQIDARTFPFLRLRATLSDTLHLATPQLVDWRVAYQPVAEIAVDPSSVVLSADSVRAGETVTVSARVLNLNDIVADTVVVSFLRIDAANVTSLIASDTLLAVASPAQIQADIQTDNAVGTNTIRVEVVQPGVVDQIQVNNVALTTLTVIGDTTPPTFDVTVDGQTFPNDPDPVTNLQDPTFPFVSSKPLVEVHIEDENPFVPLDSDTMTVTVEFDDRIVPQSELSVQTVENSNAIVVSFQPDLTGVDSTHTVRIVVQDIAGNRSPDSPYQVHFRTQSTMQLETVYPYPNPMRSFTKFAFNLRGADALNVESMRLRIYTINGRLVREFNLTEDPSALDAGALQIGWNKLRWDGRDEDGDRVATGVYLYKVFARVDGVELKSANPSAVEKVVVIR